MSEFFYTKEKVQYFSDSLSFYIEEDKAGTLPKRMKLFYADGRAWYNLPIEIWGWR